MSGRADLSAGIGAAAAVELAMERAAPAAGSEQAALPLIEAAEAVPAGGGAGESQPPASRGVGRPPGSRNRRTQAWVDWILNRHRSPLEVLAETYSRPVDELARELGCEKLEAFKLQLEAASRLAPYLHQKLPTALDVRGNGIPLLVIQEPGEPLPEHVEAEIIDLTNLEENQ